MSQMKFIEFSPVGDDEDEYEAVTEALANGWEYVDTKFTSTTSNNATWALVILNKP